ncbi:HAMP domain-containing protein [Streptomonospora sp. S1-112]|uniref:histidine kinase n=1 Tax=Streptomonospora mangrovi TaxID=2883123 RepID=A0A9X3NHC0_9ACTN|nr:ATP-binding protein [Streptomonospora mangrovi]MDA0563138.1 HAMP domain-containing protein [Streptomonospora mangrovi]
MRLTVLYGALFVATGALLLALTYLLTAHVLPLAGVEPPGSPASPAPAPLQGAAPPLDAPNAPPSPEQQSADGLRLLPIASGIALAVMAVVALGLGWVMAGRMLHPLREMAATTRDMSARDLHQRLDVRGPGDEVKDLADTFDGLLARLEASFKAQRRFVANASHELRTPITFERSVLEVALADPGAGTGDLRAACEQVLVANRRQERLIDALLDLARGQQGVAHRRPLDLAVLADACLDTADGTHDVRVAADLATAPAAGDPRLVERLVTNLVDNALRHNVPGGEATVRTGVCEGRAVLRVTNTGRVIVPEEAGLLFEPFRRPGPPRTAGDGGLGLGLSIVSAIAEAHGAALSATPRAEGGLDVRVSFPPPAAGEGGSAAAPIPPPSTPRRYRQRA